MARSSAEMEAWANGEPAGHRRPRIFSFGSHIAREGRSMIAGLVEPSREVDRLLAERAAFSAIAAAVMRSLSKRLQRRGKMSSAPNDKSPPPV